MNRHLNLAFVLVFLSILNLTCSKDDDSENESTVRDIDGNVYETVTIGTQVWMAENLKVTHYRNGDSIPNVINNTEWSNLTTGAYCNYDNEDSNAHVFGRLYNWYAVTDNHNIAPRGWHVPTDDEWQVLIDYLIGDSVAGGKMKEIGTTHWNSPNTGTTNESGFFALPGGFRDYHGNFDYIGTHAYFWSSTEEYFNKSWGRKLVYSSSEVIRGSGYMYAGHSVRCVKD